MRGCIKCPASYVIYTVVVVDCSARSVGSIAICGPYGRVSANSPTIHLLLAQGAECKIVGQVSSKQRSAMPNMIYSHNNVAHTSTHSWHIYICTYTHTYIYQPVYMITLYIYIYTSYIYLRYCHGIMFQKQIIYMHGRYNTLVYTYTAVQDICIFPLVYTSYIYCSIYDIYIDQLVHVTII